MFTPEQTNWKASEIPSFFQKRLDLREKRLAYTEKEKRQVKSKKADEILKKYFDNTSDAEMYAKKPIFGNMHPGSKRFEAILACRGGAQMGSLTFKNCKRVSPLSKFQYRKHLKVDTVTANKKFFNDYPHLAEFAKPFLPPGYASEARKNFEHAQ